MKDKLTAIQKEFEERIESASVPGQARRIESRVSRQKGRTHFDSEGHGTIER